MFDINGDGQGEFVRLAEQTRSDRRRWSAAEKAQIVAETLLPGARVADVAQRWQVCSQQVYRWRQAELVASRSAVRAAPQFVPIITEAIPAGAAARAATAAAFIAIRLSGAVVHVAAGMDDAAQLTAVLRAVRASASRT